MPVKKFFGTASAMLSLLALGACAGGESSDPQLTEPPIGIVTQISDPTQVNLPLDTYLPSREEVSALARLEIKSINNCLRANGQSGYYQVPDKLDTFISQGGRDVQVSRIWGYFDPLNMPRYGYQPPPQSVDSLETSTVGEVSDESDKKCTTEAMEMMPSKQHWSSFMHLSALPDGGPDTPSNDSRIVAAIKEWSSCMSDKGYTFANSVDAMLRWPAGEPPTGEEISQANADLECKVKTNLIGRSTAVVSTYQQRYIEEKRPALEKFSEDVRQALRRE